jgi:hypothetical protein
MKKVIKNSRKSLSLIFAIGLLGLFLVISGPIKSAEPCLKMLPNDHPWSIPVNGYGCWKFVGPNDDDWEYVGDEMSCEPNGGWEHCYVWYCRNNYLECMRGPIPDSIYSK